MSPATIPLPLGCYCWLLIVCFLWLSCVYPPGASAQEECLSLSDSKACPAFSQYSIDLADVRRRYPSLMANVTDVRSFDDRLLSASVTNDFLVALLGCSSSSNTPASQQHAVYPRYTLTHQCAILVQGGSCNKNVTPPPRLCQSTCDAWLESVMSENVAAALCRNNSSSSSSLIAQLVDQCANNVAYNGTTADGCIAGSVNEPDLCGFQSDVDSACQYCSSNNHNKDDPCCTSVLSTCNRLNDGDLLSPGAIAGIVLGSLACGALLCGLSVYLGFLRKKKKRGFSSSSNEKKNNDLSREQVNAASQQTLITIGPAACGGEKEKEDRHHPSETLQKEQYSRTITTSMAAENLYTAVHAYPPQQEDELMLYPGDTLLIAIQFDDGWGFGYNLTTGGKGALPMVCVVPSPTTTDDGDDRSSLVFQQSIMTPPRSAAAEAPAAINNNNNNNNNNTMNDSSVVLIDSPLEKDHNTTHML